MKKLLLLLVLGLFVISVKAQSGGGDTYGVKITKAISYKGFSAKSNIYYEIQSVKCSCDYDSMVVCEGIIFMNVYNSTDKSYTLTNENTSFTSENFPTNQEVVTYIKLYLKDKYSLSDKDLSENKTRILIR